MGHNLHGGGVRVGFPRRNFKFNIWEKVHVAISFCDPNLYLSLLNFRYRVSHEIGPIAKIYPVDILIYFFIPHHSLSRSKMVFFYHNNGPVRSSILENPYCKFRQGFQKIRQFLKIEKINLIYSAFLYKIVENIVI